MALFLRPDPTDRELNAADICLWAESPRYVSCSNNECVEPLFSDQGTPRPVGSMSKAMRRFRLRAITGLTLLVMFIPVAMLSLPAAALCWILGVVSLGLSMRGLDERYEGGRSGIPSNRRTRVQLITFALTALLALGSIVGLLRLIGFSPWIKERVMSQVREFSE